MATRKTPIDKLGDEISRILSEYADDVNTAMGDLVKKTVQRGAQELRSASKTAVTQHSGDYASGWTSRVETTRLAVSGTIYNAKKPGLPHLLEHGHVIRNGTGRTFGSVQAREHIQTVEEQLIETFETEVKSRL